MITIRRFKPSDTNQIAQLFHDTIRSVNRKDYSEAQVIAWAPDDIHFRDWEEKCSSKFTLIADNEGIIAGFAQLEDDGHIDCFYCRKDFLGQGIGRKLFKGIEKETRRRGLNKLYVEASITAKPFFEKMGFSVIFEQTVETRGEEFKNFLMEKLYSYLIIATETQKIPYICGRKLMEFYRTIFSINSVTSAENFSGSSQ